MPCPKVENLLCIASLPAAVGGETFVFQCLTARGQSAVELLLGMPCYLRGKGQCISFYARPTL